MSGPLPLNVSPAADLDVVALADYIARQDLAAAVRFYDAADATYREIAAAPLRPAV